MTETVTTRGGFKNGHTRIFNKPVSNKAIAERVQSYYGSWIEELSEEGGAFAEELSIALKLDDAAYTEENLPEMLNALQKLPRANAFSIDVLATGLDEEVQMGGLYFFLDEIKETEDITYKYASFNSKFAEFKSGYIANGKSGNLLDGTAENIVADEKMNWYSWGCNLHIEFDFGAYADVIDKLHEIVRKYLPAEQIKVAETEWTGENADPGALIPDLQWVVSDLKGIAGFVNEVNAEVEVLDGNYEIKADGLWFDLKHFAAAQWRVEDKKIKLLSAKL